jgi:hypothetical protein
MITDEELLCTVAEIFHHIKIHDAENNYANWHTGITHNPQKKELQQKNITQVAYFNSWQLGNQDTAQYLVIYLQEKGFKKCKSALNISAALEKFFVNSTFVFVYKSK